MRRQVVEIYHLKFSGALVALSLDRLLGGNLTRLAQAICGKGLLARRGIDSVIVLGVRLGGVADVRSETSGGLGAHAWLCVGEIVLLGDETRPGHTPIARYASVPRHHHEQTVRRDAEGATMSAILARIHLSGRPVDPDAFTKAFRTLRDYGPDGAATWIDDWCAVGHQYTAVAPEAEHQPLVDGTTVLVADAILDDRDGLVDRLGLPAEARAWPDSRLILEAVRHWGNECPAHLLGDFAFVAVDRANRSIIAARDPIGARPRSTSTTMASTIVIASDLRAFEAFGDVDTGIDDKAIVSYLVNPILARNRTFFSALEKLPPAHTLIARRGHVERKPHWRAEAVQQVRYKTFESYTEHLHDLMIRAVGDRVRTDRPVGAHISGGYFFRLCAFLRSAYCMPGPKVWRLPTLGPRQYQTTFPTLARTTSVARSKRSVSGRG